MIEILQQIAKDVKSPKSDPQKPNNDGTSNKNSESKKTTSDNENKNTDSKEKDKNVSNSSSAEETEKDSSQLKTLKKDIHEEDWSLWTNEDKEKILNIFSKVFLLNFPLYMAFKHSMQSKLDVSTLSLLLLSITIALVKFVMIVFFAEFHPITFFNVFFIIFSFLWQM